MSRATGHHRNSPSPCVKGGLVRRGVDPPGQATHYRHLIVGQTPYDVVCGLSPIRARLTGAYHCHRGAVFKAEFAADVEDGREVVNLAQEFRILWIMPGEGLDLEGGQPFHLRI